MIFKYCYVVPIVLGVWFPLTFVITYAIAVYNKNVNPAFPYISDTGAWSPESCIFGFLFNIGSILMLFIVYVRYRQIREICDKNTFKTNVRLLNVVALNVGILAVIGVTLVAHFQEVNVFSVHMFGAFLCFGLGIPYIWMQNQITYKTREIIGSNRIFVVRLVLAVVITVSFSASSGSGLIALIQFTGKDMTKWTKEDGGWTPHLVSAITEWIMATLFMVYMATFSNEFRLIDFSEPEIVPKVYTIAVYNKNVTPVFPYISDTGAWAPESCIFAFFFNVGSILMLFTVYVRYSQIREICDKNTFRTNVRLLNFLTFILGIFGVIGVNLVGNFQETNVFSVHLLGSFFCFGLGIPYIWIQNKITYVTREIFGSKSIIVVRFFLSVLTTVAFLASSSSGIIGLLQFTGDDMTKWTKEDGGWLPHFISAITEWIMAICFMVYMATFYKEFKLIDFSEPQIIPKV